MTIRMIEAPVDHPGHASHGEAAEMPLTVGTEVEVRRRFDGGWARGFTVADCSDGRYRLRRLSDGSVLPVAFPPLDVREARLVGR